MRKTGSGSSEITETAQRKSILCPQPHTTQLSMSTVQSSDEPTTDTREGEVKEGYSADERGAGGDSQ